MKLILVLLIFSSFILLSHAADRHCHPTIESSLKQYIIGHGSLMNEMSKRRTVKKVGASIPVIVQGLERGWFVSSHTPGLNASYLDIRENTTTSINAVVFQIHSSLIANYDKREKSYCRKRIARTHIQSLLPTPLPKRAIFWAYLGQTAHQTRPSHEHPIVQSYVDLFFEWMYSIRN